MEKCYLFNYCFALKSSGSEMWNMFQVQVLTTETARTFLKNVKNFFPYINLMNFFSVADDNSFFAVLKPSHTEN